MPVLKAYFWASWKYPVMFIAVYALGALVQAADVAAPWYLGQFIDALTKSTPGAAVVHTLLVLLVLFGTMRLLVWAGLQSQFTVLNRFEVKVMANLANSAFDYLMGHSHDYFQSNFTGTLVRRVTRYTRAYEQIFDTLLFNFFATFLFAGGVIAVLWYKNTLLGIGLTVWTVVFVVVQFLLARWRQPLRIARSELDSKQTGALSDAVTNQQAVSLFAAGAHERHIFGDITDALRAAILRVWTAEQKIIAVQGFLGVVIQVGLLYGAIILWQHGVITVGDFVLLQVYVITLIDRLWNLGNMMRGLYNAFADAYEMVVVMNTPHEIQNAPDAKPLTVTEGAIQFEHVDFNFHETRSIFKDFNLSIKPGEKVALVGTSGAGKSTVTKLLLRLYDLTAGHILIDGQDIAKVTQDSLRSQIAFVPQEPILFHRSLMENIRYGRLNASDEEVIEAARKAHCHEFITQLSEGYDTLVGERGVKLSGGERQRVAIARAILKNAPILILDEATSSLDSESEALIQDALNTLMEGKTILIIAHRLSTIMSVDRILVLEAGTIVDEGTHQELLKRKGGLYQKLWNIQAGGFLQDSA